MATIISKIQNARSVHELREATAKGFEALSIEEQLDTRLKAVELKLAEMEAV